MLDFKSHLNDSQRAAVTTVNGPIVVIAGAGSGKTRVIAYRVLYLVQNKISPNSILLLTFTRRAAKTMLDRAAKHEIRCKNVEGGTFHSFAYKMLKRYAKYIGFTDSFSVLDEGDSEEAIHKCCNNLGFFERDIRFPRKDTLKKIISMSINKNISFEGVLMKEYPHLIDYSSDIEKLWEKYTEYKINKNYADFDDLLLYLSILLKISDIQTIFSNKYRYIMVDEYQDTNTLQGNITHLLAIKHRNVMVVGDDAQSIYGFRGSSHENIMNFPKIFPECKEFKLEENYRSTQSILDIANSVLENMVNKYSKCLVSANKRIGNKPQLKFFKNQYSEAEWVASKIKELFDEGILFNKQAVLYRSAFISIPLQVELTKRNIPFQVFGGRKFSETAHVKDIISHLKVIVNPRDELAWNRVLMLITGIGPIIAGKLVEEILALSNLKEIIEKVIFKYNKKYKFSEELIKLGSTLKSIHKGNLTVADQFEIILDYYNPILKNKFDDWNRRINDLITLNQICARYNSLEDFLLDLALEPPEKGVVGIDATVPDDEKPLTLSTIHSAKGLEWESVFFIGLIDGVLPSSYSLNHQEDIEEEHRLFYVGITRARNHLFLSLHHEGTRGGISHFNKASRFINVPNVLSNLEIISEKKKEPTYVYEEPKKIEPIYDKKSLLEKILDIFK